MKICLFGISGIPLGKHNLKDPRLDQADKLVEAKKKIYAQADLLGEEQLSDADSVLVRRETLDDLLLKDLEFVETRLGRNPSAEEAVVLNKIKSALENGKTVRDASLTNEEVQALAAQSFVTNKPVVVAAENELADPEPLLLRAFAESGYISFLTVGGKENRAWPIPKGTTAWEAAGSIHSDMQKGFIRAEIISFGDFLEAGGETQAKRAGKLRLEMKPYVIHDYDLVNFRFNK